MTKQEIIKIQEKENIIWHEAMECERTFGVDHEKTKYIWGKWAGMFELLADFNINIERKMP